MSEVRRLKTKRPNRSKLKNFKLRIMLVVLLIGLCMMIYETISIYIAHADEFRQITIRQQVYGRRGHTDRAITPNRGSIFDRNGQPIAVSNTVYNIFIDVRLLAMADEEEIELTIYALYEVFGIEPDRILTYIAINPETERPNRNTHFLVIERGVDPIREGALRNFGLLHVHSEEDTIRTYPAGLTTSNIVGFLSGDGNHWGLERTYDNFLTGTPGRLVRMFNEAGAVVTNQFPPTVGYTIVTTLDLRLQQTAHDIVSEFGGRYNARTAQVIVMEPNTGEILAMAQYPTFNNNFPFNVNYINSQRIQNHIYYMTDYERTESLFGVWANTAISHSFEPGSIFKPIIHAAALEEGLTHPGEQFFCGGFLTIAGYRIRCWIYPHAHGTITLEQSMALSCNVVSMRLGERLGRDLFYEYLRDFGIGQLTGIDISGEASFFPLTLPRHQLNPVEIATGSFGQGFNMTAIQSLVSFSAIINGGNVVIPYVVSQVIEGDNIIHENLPTIRRNVLSESTSRLWRYAMVGTISWYRGTGIHARIDGYEIGGKTGTAEVAERIAGVYVYTFLAYLPADNPRYAVLVNLERPQPDPGSGPIQRMMRSVLMELILQRGIRPYDSSDIESSPMVIIENYVGMNFVEAFTRISDKDLLPSSSGTGNIVIGQSPLPGTPVPRGSTIILHVGVDENVSDLVTIPSIVGMTTAMASDALQALGLDYNFLPANPYMNMQYIEETGGGVVINQNPQAGVRLPNDMTMMLVVSDVPLDEPDYEYIEEN